MRALVAKLQLAAGDVQPYGTSDWERADWLAGYLCSLKQQAAAHLRSVNFYSQQRDVLQGICRDARVAFEMLSMGHGDGQALATDVVNRIDTALRR